MINAVFVNSGILGQRTFAKFVSRHLIDDDSHIRARQVIVSDNLSFYQKARRRLLCAPVVPSQRMLKNVDLLRFRAEWNAGIVAAEKLAEIERSQGAANVLHFHRQATAYASIDRMKRTPSIVSIDCTQGIVANGATAVEKLSYRPNVRRDGKIFSVAKMIISTSEWAAACLKHEYPACDTEIAVRANPVDTQIFDDDLAAQRLKRCTHSARKAEVLFLAGDFERKGGRDLLEAWQQGRFSDVAVLKIVTARNVRCLQIPGVVWLSDISALTSEWRDLWQNADIFAMPTREEAFGMVFQEAGAAGLPSIGTRINAIPEIVLDGQTGLLIQPRNVGELVRAIRILIESPDLRYRMGVAARRHMERTADPIRYAAFLTDSIKRVAGH
jgi:alpha-maltose-1-phosphate synthase